MIEDEKDGIKIAENPEEAFWTTMKQKTEEMILQCQHEIIIQENLLRLCEDKLKPFSKA